MQTEKVTSVFIAWQQPESRLWFPVGKLESDLQQGHFVFNYTKGALRAKREAGFEEFVAFPDLKASYESTSLFPLFNNRLWAKGRRDFASYVQSLGLDPAHVDPLEMLAVSGGERQTDTIAVFPNIHAADDGRFSTRFFVHGIRHVSEAGQERAGLLKIGDKLHAAIELGNPATGRAVLMLSDDYQVIGWAPRYLVDDLIAGMVESKNEFIASVVRVNGLDVPPARRVLVEFEGRLPLGKEPMSGEDFQILH